MAGVCLSSLGPHSGSSQEAPVIVWSPPDVDRSLLASASVVSGASGSGGGRSGDTSSVQRSSQTTSLSSIPSGGVKAVSSCFFFFFFFYINGNTERAKCALSRVCIP